MLPSTAPGSVGDNQPGRATKESRQRTPQACDACHARKTKMSRRAHPCFWEGRTCRSCLELDIACTKQRLQKRRGPVNRYVQAQKQRGSPVNSPTTLSPSIDAASPSQSVNNVLEKLGPPSVIRQIIDDWFELVHSVAPILHRAQFLERLENGDATRDLEFCGLVVSVCAATVVTLRRRSSAQYGSITFERCLKAVQENQLLESKENFSLEWCQTKYNLGASVCSERGVNDPLGFRFMSEATMGVKYLVYYQLPTMSLVSQQLLKRLYWLIFVGLCVEMFGSPFVSLLTPRDNVQALRPLDMTDRDLSPAHVSTGKPWHGDTMSYIPGLNHLSNLFLLWHSSQQLHNNNISGPQEHIVLVQQALDDLPAELRWRGGLSRPPRSNFGTDVQVANLYITQLHIRSNILEQLGRLAEGQSDLTAAQNILSQRRSLVEDSLEIISHMPQEALEANGHSLIPKIRDIGAALLEKVRMVDGSQLANEQAGPDLRRLLEKLEKLDCRAEFSRLGLES